MEYRKKTIWDSGFGKVTVNNSLDGIKRVFAEGIMAESLADLDALIALLQGEVRAEFEQPETLDTVYNWNNAPDWAMWASVDDDGCAEWHDTEPYYSETRKFWVPGDKIKAIDPADILHNLPAADSLEKRPG